jgi:hypothetical protein
LFKEGIASSYGEMAPRMMPVFVLFLGVIFSIKCYIIWSSINDDSLPTELIKDILYSSPSFTVLPTDLLLSQDLVCTLLSRSSWSFYTQICAVWGLISSLIAAYRTEYLLSYTRKKNRSFFCIHILFVVGYILFFWNLFLLIIVSTVD